MFPVGWLGSAHFDSLTGLCAFALVCSLLFGGGTHGGFLADTIVQAAAIPVLLLVIWRSLDAPFDWKKRLPWGFCLALLALPALQLLPLPAWLWTLLPARQPEADAFTLLGRPLPWMPASVSPQATWVAMLSLLPPVAIGLATSLLTAYQRRMLSLLIIAFGILSVLTGLLQVAQGQSSPLRFFAFTNTTEAVGFFANRNHFAALLYTVTVFAAAWAVDATSPAVQPAPLQQPAFDPKRLIAMIAGFTIVVILVGAQAMARSRAGLGLTILALFAALALALSDKRNTAGLTPAKLMAGAVVFAGLFATQFALYRIMQRFASDPLADARFPIARNTFDAAMAHMPFGSGLGTFVQVYGLYETPGDAMVNAYANHAHNDVLEFWLETGMFGLAAMVLFVGWLAMRSFDVWRRERPGLGKIDQLLMRAATVVAGLLAAHSFFDYPLRTGAMMAVMAFSCALLVEPAPAPQHEAVQRAPAANRKDRRPSPRWQPARAPLVAGAMAEPAAQVRPAGSEPLSAASANPPKPAAAAAAGELWGQDIEWPAEWRASPKSQHAGADSEVPLGPAKPPGR